MKTSIEELIVINGNNIDILKTYPDNYFDSVVTDPPYGLGKEPNAAELMKDWVENGYHEVSGSGFMGKEWDAFVPQPVFWKEVFRVLKHGGHVVAFYGTRTYDWGVMSMRFAGFEVRDCIQWLYGSGFPKSHNISKALDKMEGNETKNNSEWEGWGSALKPANEPIVLARKPLEKGLSIAENIIKWGVGGINIDGCRIGNVGGTIKTNTEDCFDNNIYGDGLNGGIKTFVDGLGRFPANIIFTHHPECECIGTKKAGKGERKQHQDGEVSSANEGYTRPNKNMHTHKDSSVIANYGEETIEDWDCHEDCPIRILDQQSGTLKSGKMKATHTRHTDGSPNGIYGKFDGNHPLAETYGDTGGASRFFYVAKASKAERNKGLEGFDDKYSASAEFRPNHMEKAIDGDSGNPYGRWTPIKNFHPTVKPIKLMQYLVKMITPPNGIVLDPFCGSGTTGVACKLDGFRFVGMEQDPEYSKIAEGRINNYVEENGKVKKIKPITNQTTLF